MIEQAIHIARNTSPSEWKRGSCAAFVRMNPIWGVKVFTREEDRDTSVKFQGLAATHNLGPAVGPIFEAEIRHLSWPGRLSYGMMTIVADTSRRIPKGMIRQLTKRLEKVGIINVDPRNCNFGWLGDRLVCIDFDCCYESEEDINRCAVMV
jgi:hypothetical protein